MTGRDEVLILAASVTIAYGISSQIDENWRIIIGLCIILALLIAFMFWLVMRMLTGMGGEDDS